MAVIIGLEPGRSKGSSERFLLRDECGAELVVYALSEKVQRYIREAGLGPGTEFAPEAFRAYTRSGDIFGWPSEAPRLIEGRNAQPRLQTLPFEVAATSRLGVVGSFERVLSSQEGWVRLLLTVIFPGSTAEERVEVWMYQEERPRGRDAGVSPPQTGDVLRFYSERRVHPSNRVFSSEMRLAVVAPYAFPVSEEYLLDRKGRRWQIKEFGSTKYINAITLLDLRTGKRQRFRCSELIWQGETLVYQGLSTDGTATWKVLSLGSNLGRELGAPWRQLAQFQAGEVSAEDVDWEAAGRVIRQTLEAGKYLPRPIWKQWSAIKTAQGRRLSHVWNDLRRDHINTCWMHLRAHLTLGQLAAGTARDWNIDRIHRKFCDEFDEHVTESFWPFPRLPYASYWSAIPPHYFWAKTIHLGQLVELSEKRRRAPIRRALLLDGIRRDLGLDEFGEGRGIWQEVFNELPPAREQYRRFALTKASGKPRWIDEPCPELARIQTRIASILGAYRAAHPCATGFVPGRSAVLHARMHEGARTAVSVDIRDFFPSISRDQVHEALKVNLDAGQYRGRWRNPFKNWDDFSLYCLAMLVTHPFDKRLPQGAPSSPSVANLVAYTLDEDIVAMMRQLKYSSTFRYSRYADDLVISSTRKLDADIVARLREILKVAVEKMGWALAEEKTRVWRASERRPLEICSLVVPRHVGGPLGLPREVRRRLRAALHHADTGAAMPEDVGLIAYAYAVSGEHPLRMRISPQTRDHVASIADALVPWSARPAFVRGWMENETPGGNPSGGS